MNQPDHADLIGAQPYSVGELRDAVFRGTGPLTRTLALGLLGQMEYPEKQQDLQLLLTDDRQPGDLRRVAALLLGEIGTREAEATLMAALTIADELALRGVIEALAHTRSELARAEVATLADHPAPVGPTAAWVARLLSYRLNMPGPDEAIPATLPLLPVDADRAVPIETMSATTEETATARANLTRADPGLRLTDRGSVALRCQGEALLLLLDENVASGEGNLATTRLDAGVLAVARTTEGAGWEAQYHILVAPRTDREVTILGMTPKGKLVLAGTGRLAGSHVDFEIRTVDHGGALPVELHGSYDPGVVRFVQATSDTVRTRSAEPSRDTAA